MALALGLGIIIGHFAIKKNQTGKYDNITRQADSKNYKTFIDSIKAANIEDNLR